MQAGWEEYDRRFDEHLQMWIASELTQGQLTQQVIATAARLREQSGGQWTLEVKAKIPELLAGIFALYAILRSGKAYSAALSSATEGEEKSEAVEAEELSCFASDFNFPFSPDSWVGSVRFGRGLEICSNPLCYLGSMLAYFFDSLHTVNSIVLPKPWKVVPLALVSRVCSKCLFPQQPLARICWSNLTAFRSWRCWHWLAMGTTELIWRITWCRSARAKGSRSLLEVVQHFWLCWATVFGAFVIQNTSARGMRVHSARCLQSCSYRTRVLVALSTARLPSTVAQHPNWAPQVCKTRFSRCWLYVPLKDPKHGLKLETRLGASWTVIKITTAGLRCRVEGLDTLIRWSAASNSEVRTSQHRRVTSGNLPMSWWRPASWRSLVPPKKWKPYRPTTEPWWMVNTSQTVAQQPTSAGGFARRLLQEISS